MSAPAQYWSCERKRQYTRRAVQKARQRVLEKFGRKLRAYKCEYGNHWHLTKQSLQKRVTR